MVALYACGCFSKVEIGRFGMSLEEAKKKFLNFVEKKELSLWKIEETDDKITVRFQIDNNETHQKLENLITGLAKATTLHGKPPTKYYLIKESSVSSGEYLPTNSYCG